MTYAIAGAVGVVIAIVGLLAGPRLIRWAFGWLLNR